MRVYDIESPEQIKGLTIPELEELAADIRSFLIHSISKTGGHLSSNLGVIETTIAMHYVFDSPKDKIIFDVGHQCYTHKILTGRSIHFSTLRQLGGLSGYQKRNESIHDCWEAGHSSTSLSAALGFAAARDIRHQDYNIIALIGDGALTGGEAMEALNDIGSQQRRMIIVYNDNNMSISRNHGGVEKRITSARSSHLYRNIKKEMKHGLSHGKVGESVLKSMTAVRDSIKNKIIDAPLFKEFNLDYIGPVNGHDIQELINVFETVKDHDGPIVVHVLTKKGKGYSFAEQDTEGKWHGVTPFHIATGQSIAKLPPNQLSWSEIVSRTLMDFAIDNPDLVAITPAMAQGSKLVEFSKKYPDRFFDCGIAEQHAITMACGMAAGGLHPFVSVYSSFLQRAYDQMNHDLGRMRLPVVVGIDRAGIVGEDGDTHQGVFDIAMLRNIPNLILSQPKDGAEMQNLLYTAFEKKEPYCIRYPRGVVPYEKNRKYEIIETGTWTKFTVGDAPACIVITYGPDVDRIIHTAKENDISMIVVNARFFKPVDELMLNDIFESGLPIYVYEPDCIIGSLSSAILEYKNQRYKDINIVGIHDHYVCHGSVRALRKLEKIDLESLFKEITKDGRETA